MIRVQYFELALLGTLIALVLRFVNSVTYFWPGSGHETIRFWAELGKEVMKIAASEAPLERLCGFLVALLKPD